MRRRQVKSIFFGKFDGVGVLDGADVGGTGGRDETSKVFIFGADDDAIDGVGGGYGVVADGGDLSGGIFVVMVAAGILVVVLVLEFLLIVVRFPNPLAPDIQIYVSWGTRLGAT